MHGSLLLLAMSVVTALSTPASRCRDSEVSAILDSFSCDLPSVRQQCLESSANLPITGLVQCLTTSGCRRSNQQILHMPVTCDSEESVGPTEIRNRDSGRSGYGHGRRIVQRQFEDNNSNNNNQPAATSDSSPTTQDQAAATSSQSFGTTVTVQPSTSDAATSSRPTATTITVPASAASTTSSSTSSQISSASTSTATSNPSGSKVGTAGIILGAIFGLIVLCSVIFVIFINVRRSRRSRQEAKRESTAYHALITPPEAKRGPNMYSSTTLAGSFLGQDQDPENQSTTYYNDSQHHDIPLGTVQAGRSFSNEDSRRISTRSTSAGLLPTEAPYDPYNPNPHARHDSVSGVITPPRVEPASASPPSAHPQSRGPAPPLPSARISFSTPRPGSYAAARHTRSTSSISSASGLARQFSFDGGPADISRESSRAGATAAPPVPQLHIRTDNSGVHMVPTILTPGSPPF